MFLHQHHARLWTDVFGQGMQGTQSLARLGKETSVGVYIQMYEVVLNVAYGFAKAFKVGEQKGVFITILRYGFRQTPSV